MKKLIGLFNTATLIYGVWCMAIMVTLSGCALIKSNESASEPFTITGNFVSYEQHPVDDSSIQTTITVDCSGELKQVVYTAAIPDIENMTDEFVITLTGDLVDGVYKGSGVSVDYIPLSAELGYDGYDLMGNTYEEYTFHSLLAQTYFTYVRKSNGREYTSSSKASHYIDQDENAAYHNVVKTIKNEQGSDVSYSESTYTDRVTGELFTLINYGEWKGYLTDSTALVSFAVNREDMTVDVFDRVQDAIRVKGSLNGIPARSYLEYLMIDTMGDMYSSIGNVEVTFDARFDESTRNVGYIEYIISMDDFQYDGSTYSVTELKMELNGMAFGNTDKVEIPNYARVPIYDDLVLLPEETTIVTCADILGITLDDIDDDFILSIIGDVYSDEDITSSCDMDILMSSAAYIILTWDIDQLYQDLSRQDRETRIAAERIAEYMSGVPMAY